MNDLVFNIQILLKKCELLDNFCHLQLRKDTIQIELKQLRKQAKNVNKILGETKELYKTKLPTLKIECQQVLRIMKQQHFVAMNLLLQIKKKKLKQPQVFQQATKILPNLSATPLKGCNVTPRMYLSEYANSPYVRLRKIPRQIEFINFEIQVNADAFECIPKYMKGRETLTELQQFLDDTVISCFNGKYQLMYKKKEAIKANELPIWRSYNAQSTLFPNKHFISQEDIVKKINKTKIDRNSLAKLTMLRHLGVIQIEQVEQLVFYIWLEK